MSKSFNWGRHVRPIRARPCFLEQIGRRPAGSMQVPNGVLGQRGSGVRGHKGPEQTRKP